MFWKRKIKENETLIIDSQFGEFVWSHSYAWYCDYEYRNSKLSLTYIGNKFNLNDLDQFQKALDSLESLMASALNEVKDDIEHYDHSKEQMELFGICIDPSENDEDFQLEFNFENWPDGGLTVHFKNEKVIASSIDD